MAPLSLLLSFIGKKVGTILQAIFGWSVTALFGRLDFKREIAVTVALVLSLAWPLFVLGSFLPGVAAWALAFLPIQDWIGQGALRAIWIALAVFAPPLVGVLVQWAAPTPRGTYVRALAAGFPLAIGFFAAFLVTVITAPVVKILAAARGRSDTHLFVQARDGQYDDLVRKVAESCARAGLLPEVVDAPRRMTLATNVLRSLAKSAVQPFLGETLRLVRADGIEAYVYPSDLLLRGPADNVARVRAMMTRADVDVVAYVVKSEEGRKLQDELQRLAGVLARHAEASTPVGAMFGSRLVEIWRDVCEAELPYEEWALLDGIVRRLEREYVRANGAEAFVVDAAPDGLARIAEKANLPAQAPRLRFV